MPTGSGSTQKRPDRRLPWLVALYVLPLILVILASAIYLAMAHLRRVVMEQIAQRDGYVLNLASKVQIDPEFAKDPELRPMAIENKALEASSLLTNVIAMRLYDSAGNPQTIFPENVRPAKLSPADQARAERLNLASQFIPAADLVEIFDALPGLTDRVPLLRVVVPLESEASLIGIAEFYMDGRDVQAAYRELNSDLWKYGGLIFGVGGVLIVISLTLAFGRLQKANQLVEDRTEKLLRANHELTLAAKTSALGAITAHLIHDLKNPLFGLQTFVSAKRTDAGLDDEDWSLAFSTTEKMKKLIDEVVRILKEEKTSEYELSVEELLGVLRSKTEGLAREAGIEISTASHSGAMLSNRDANIVLLILSNLVDNALQALGTGGYVHIAGLQSGGDLVFEITDNGPGLPDSVLGTLFTPSRSTKTGGTGLGLAISRQLANHASAELLLKETSPTGTTFQLRLTNRLLHRAPRSELAAN